MSRLWWSAHTLQLPIMRKHGYDFTHSLHVSARCCILLALRTCGDIKSVRDKAGLPTEISPMSMNEVAAALADSLGVDPVELWLAANSSRGYASGHLCCCGLQATICEACNGNNRCRQLAVDAGFAGTK